MSKKTGIILGFIILLAALLRLWGLGSVPVSPDWDEAALGYNAYSILHTGKDEYGTVMPLILKSFDDYKPALYAYTIIPFIPFFDLTLLAVRLPSALLGILSVYITFLLVKELFKRTDLALLSAFLLSVSPWHIQFSRVAFESNLALSCIILMAYTFIKGLTRPWLLSFSTVFAALSIYSYQSEKVFAPLFMLLLVGVFYKELLSLPRKYLGAAAIVGMVMIMPLIITIAFDHHSLSRAKQTSIFTKQTDQATRDVQRFMLDKQKGDVIGYIFDNKYQYFAKQVFAGYISHFTPNWLFITGDIERHHAPGMGLLYLIEFPFLLLGIYVMIFVKEYRRKGTLFIFLWLLLAPIPASITIDVPHAVRTLNFLPTFQILIAAGVISAVLFLKKQPVLLRYGIGGLLCLCAIANGSYYLNQYFVQQNYYYSANWQYGYKDIVSYVEKEKSSYSHVIISDRVPMDQSYIFFLFYTKYDPATYQKNAKRGSIEYSLAYDKYTFKKIDWSTDMKSPNTLIIGMSTDFPDDVPTLYKKDYLDGKPGMKIVETK